MKRWLRIFKHRWADAGDTRRALPNDMAERLAQRVAASEARHCGEVRLCVEAALPMSYLWRIRSPSALPTVVRERAISWFGRLGVWDTERNNGVLIYLLLAERCIEIVADRALAPHVSDVQWKAMVERLGQKLQQTQWEDGLTQALEEVSAVLAQHFPAPPEGYRHNELSNTVVRA